VVSQSDVGNDSTVKQSWYTSQSANDHHYMQTYVYIVSVIRCSETMKHITAAYVINFSLQVISVEYA